MGFLPSKLWYHWVGTWDTWCWGFQCYAFLLFRFCVHAGQPGLWSLRMGHHREGKRIDGCAIFGEGTTDSEASNYSCNKTVLPLNPWDSKASDCWLFFPCMKWLLLAITNHHWSYGSHIVPTWSPHGSYISIINPCLFPFVSDGWTASQPRRVQGASAETHRRGASHGGRELWMCLVCG